MIKNSNIQEVYPVPKKDIKHHQIRKYKKKMELVKLRKIDTQIKTKNMN